MGTCQNRAFPPQFWESETTDVVLKSDLKYLAKELNKYAAYVEELYLSTAAG